MKNFESLKKMYERVTGRYYVDVHDAKYDVDILH